MTFRLRTTLNPALARIASPDRLARLFVVLVCVSVLGITAWRVNFAHDLALRESQTATANLARSLANNANSTMETADILLAGIVERIEADGISGAALVRLHRVMLARTVAVPRVRDMVVMGADGCWLASSLPADMRYCNADREYFTYHRAHADKGAHIGPPVQSRSSGRWTINVSRRFDAPDGSFGGVVVATIDFDTFRALYASFDIGAHGSIALTNADGTLLVRVPEMPQAIGVSLAASPFFREFKAHGPVGNSVAVSQVDGVARLNSFHATDSYPLVVFVALSQADVLAGWQVGALTALGTACAVTLVLGGLGWRLAAQIRLRHAADAAVRRSERQYRLLADYSTDLIMQIGPDFRRVYVSPASTALLGYTPQELIGGHPRELIHPEDWPLLTDHLALEAESGQVSPIGYRVRRKDGTYIWLEAIGRLLEDGISYVVALRDITQRKHAEMLLHQANNRLQRTVMLDGLTGIANRRCFDSVLDKEFRRAIRAETPLALLMLDVDCFKMFNDTYGHPAGDACLKAIANVLGKLMQRPADLAARYGGEEFAVVLPETDGPGARSLAERIRHAVHGLEIPHAGAAGGVATVSIGVAVVWPQRQGQSAHELLARADAALYRAKSMGRDYVYADIAASPGTAGPLASLPATTQAD